VEEIAGEMGVDPGRIAIRAQRTRWGSCSSKGNLNFNCLLVLLPENVQRYVVVHELCHLRELNHSKRFWASVARYQPTYLADRKQLKREGAPLIARLPHA
ncbi:MAG: M48 family metallopeptidase, partial [Lachnospiraceae bacterium]|nr:M48 family metallopeptidase [Lachnospiraceae bacterium]